MKYLVFIAIIFSFPVLSASDDNSILQPQSFKSRLTEKAHATYTINGELYYLVNQCRGCIDKGSTLYDANGNSVCSFIGIAGKWDTKCSKMLSKIKPFPKNFESDAK